jgi:hypothetical protein
MVPTMTVLPFGIVMIVGVIYLDTNNCTILRETSAKFGLLLPAKSRNSYANYDHDAA